MAAKFEEFCIQTFFEPKFKEFEEYKMQNLWGKRFTALIIDAFVISLIIWILSALIYPLIGLVGGFGILNYWPILTVLIITGYFTYLEGNYSTTFGKTLMKIRVVSDKDKLNYQKAFIRNLSKILWIPLIIDLIAGYAAGGSKIRYLDKIAGTDVISLAVEDKKAAENSKEPESVV